MWCIEHSVALLKSRGQLVGATQRPQRRRVWESERARVTVKETRAGVSGEDEGQVRENSRTDLQR